MSSLSKIKCPWRIPVWNSPHQKDQHKLINFDGSIDEASGFDYTFHLGPKRPLRHIFFQAKCAALRRWKGHFTARCREPQQRVIIVGPRTVQCLFKALSGWLAGIAGPCWVRSGPGPGPPDSGWSASFCSDQWQWPFLQISLVWYVCTYNIDCWRGGQEIWVKRKILGMRIASSEWNAGFSLLKKHKRFPNYEY